MCLYQSTLFACGCCCTREWDYCDTVLKGNECTDYEEQPSRMQGEMCDECQKAADAWDEVEKLLESEAAKEKREEEGSGG